MEILTGEGYSVVGMARGEEVLKKLRMERFDAVITDTSAAGKVTAGVTLSEFERFHPGKPMLLITAQRRSTLGE